MANDTKDRLIDVEAEQSVLGACLSDEKAVGVVEVILAPEDFASDDHAKIFSAILLTRETGPVDLVRVCSTLQDIGQLEEGTLAYLIRLVESLPTSANVDFHAQRVKDRAIRRQIYRAAEEVAVGAAEGTIDEVLGKADSLFREVSNETRHDSDFVSTREIVSLAFEQIEANWARQGSISGTPTGFDDLDRLLSGLQNGDLIIVAARPSVGKTAFALNVAQRISIDIPMPTAVFSLEMSKEQLVNRMLCAEGHVDSSRIRSGALLEEDWPRLTMAASVVGEAPIYVLDKADITVGEIRTKTRRLQERVGKLGVVIIDYLQLIGGGSGDNRTAQVGHDTRQLKLMARQLGVPVILLSQLNRAVEQRANKRPIMSDLRESGSIEQDADVIAFLHRDDYYDPESEKKNIIEIIIAKQRSGPTGTAELVFLKQYNKFIALQRAPESNPRPAQSENTERGV